MSGQDEETKSASDAKGTNSGGRSENPWPTHPGAAAALIVLCEIEGKSSLQSVVARDVSGVRSEEAAAAAAMAGTIGRQRSHRRASNQCSILGKRLVKHPSDELHKAVNDCNYAPALSKSTTPTFDP